ncbi:hypothetical protein FB451DRAFT_245548, partial [Mycena latifolia]
MPLQPTTAQIRFDNIVICLTTAVTTLEVVSASLKTPFLGAISNTVRSLLSVVQTVKRNKDDCTQLLEQIYALLYGIIRLHTNLESGTELSPNMLENLGKFTDTLHKIHTFVEAQQDKNKIKQLFRHGELSTLLKSCKVGLEQALAVFKLQGVGVLTDMSEMQQYAQKRHQEIVELISALSDEGSPDDGSSISGVFSSNHNSSNSLSLLPSEPKIFYGRETEVSAIIKMFNQQSPRIAILGTGGMGKTSLARVILHHPEITPRYGEHRVFVTCDAVSSSVQLAALIAAHVGLKPGKNLTRPIVRHFSTSAPCLLVLDNFETIWEPRESRGEVEKFLCLLADVPHLTLIITMRGAERPVNIQWTHPFLEPLKPLTLDAARKTFIDIVDDGHSAEDVDKILHLTGNMPLAIDLMAHLVDYEGFGSVLARWEKERTSLLSDGYDKGSNLDFSISMSLTSPRIMALPQSQDLLSLLSLLPDGLSDAELVQSKLPIDNILACKATLLRTSLAYTDDQRRLKALVPIREYVQKMHPPAPLLTGPLLQYFHELFQLYETYRGTAASSGIVARIAPNFANIHSILVKSLHGGHPDLINTIYCACHFDKISGMLGYGRSHLIDLIPNVLPHPRDPIVSVYFITQLLRGYLHHPIPNAEDLVNEALGYFPQFDDPDLKCRFYSSTAVFYQGHAFDIPRSMQLCEAGLALSTSTGNTRRQSQFLDTLAWIKWRSGDPLEAQALAYESQRLARISADLFHEAQALRIESLCWKSLGNYSHCSSLLTRSRYLLSLCGLSKGETDYAVMNDQAEVHRLKSEYVEALHIQRQILHTTEEPYQLAVVSLNMAQIEVEIDTPKEDVHKHIDRANLRFSMIGYPVGFMYSDMIRAALCMREGDLLIAKNLFEKCLNIAWTKDNEAVSNCLESLGDFQKWRSLDQASPMRTVTFLVYVLQKKQKLEIYKAFQFLSDVCLAEGDQYTAISLLTVALRGFTQMDVHRSRAECMLRLGDIAKQDKDTVKARELWNRARPLFELSSQARQVAYIDERFALVSDSLEPLPQPSNLEATTASLTEFEVTLPDARA